MIDLTTEYIKALEAAAMFELTDDERAEFTALVRRIASGELMSDSLDAKLAELEPMLQPLPLRNVMRDDVIRQDVSLDELQDSAIATYGGYFEAPLTLE